MYTIRQGIFETNSSSTDAFVIPNDAVVSSYSLEIKRSVLTAYKYSLDENPSIEDKLAFMYNKAEDNGCSKSFLMWLLSKGITVIDDIQENDSFDDYMFGNYMSEADLCKWLFNSNSLYYDRYPSDLSNKHDYNVVTFNN